MSSNQQKKILLTGATGFLGKALMARLIEDDTISLRVTARSKIKPIPDPRVTIAPSLNLSADSNWLEALEGCNIVIHTAARVHVMNDTSDNPLNEFRQVNVDGTLQLARQAAQQGVKRFIFISSIKVNGEATHNNHAFRASDKHHPEDPYAISKYEAEQGLQQLSFETGMEVVIIRPPLVYGPGVKGNFIRLLYWVEKGIPLPFGSIHNKRSFVSIDNLISLIVTCIDHPRAANQVFLVSDGHDLSTTELLRKISKVMNKSTRLLPIPSWVLSMFAGMLGKKADFNRLCGSLQLDISKTCEMLDWEPAVSVVEALGLLVHHYAANQAR